MINSVRHNKCLQGSEALNPTVAIKIQIAHSLHNSLRSSMMNKNCCCTLRLWLSGVTDATDCTHILTSTARGQLSQRWQTQREKTILHEWMCLHQQAGLRLSPWHRLFLQRASRYLLTDGIYVATWALHYTDVWIPHYHFQMHLRLEIFIYIGIRKGLR